MSPNNDSILKHPLLVEQRKRLQDVADAIKALHSTAELSITSAFVQALPIRYATKYLKDDIQHALSYWVIDWDDAVNNRYGKEDPNE